jgi:hypothetical protein
METKNKNTKFAYIDAEIHKALKIKSAQTDTTVGKYINDILRSFVENQPTQK